LFYNSITTLTLGKLVAVAINTRPTFTNGRPVPVAVEGPVSEGSSSRSTKMILAGITSFMSSVRANGR
jgi:hypothetical protein